MMSRRAWTYSTLAWAVAVVGLLIVEAWAYTGHFTVFVPLTWVFISGSIAAPVLTLGVGILMGHFVLPLFPGWRRWAVIALNAASAALLYGPESRMDTYRPGSAFFGGIVVGALFFVAGDRRKLGVTVRPAYVVYWLDRGTMVPLFLSATPGPRGAYLSPDPPRCTAFPTQAAALAALERDIQLGRGLCATIAEADRSEQIVRSSYRVAGADIARAHGYELQKEGA